MSKRVRSITFTILTESPVALSNDQGTGGNFTPIKKYFYKDGQHAMTSVATITYELRKKLYTDYGWQLNDLVIKKSNSKIKNGDVSNEEADVFGFLIPDSQLSKTSPLRIIPFISVNSFKNDTQLITNRGLFNQELNRNFYDEKENLLTDDKIPKTQALANEEIFGDYYYYTVTLELDRIGRCEINEQGKYLPPEKYSYRDNEFRKKIIKDIISALTELTRNIKHQTVHLKPLAVYGGIFEKVIPYFWNDVRFVSGRMDLKTFYTTVNDYKLYENGCILAGIDNRITVKELNNKLQENIEDLKSKNPNYLTNEELQEITPVSAMKKVEDLIDKGKLTIKDKFWYLED